MTMNPLIRDHESINTWIHDYETMTSYLADEVCANQWAYSTFSLMEYELYVWLKLDL